VKEKIYAQKIKKECNSPVELAQKYYSTLLVLNNISLSQREIELISFTAVRGTISSSSAKDEFIRQFGSSVDTINNMISKLRKKSLLIKQNGKTKIHPSIALDFNHKTFVIQLKLNIKPKDGLSEGMVKEDN